MDVNEFPLPALNHLSVETLLALGAPGMPRDIDLELGSLWFAHTPATLPFSLRRLVSKNVVKLAIYSDQRLGDERAHTVVGAIRWSHNLSTTRFRITWLSGNPAGTVEARQRHWGPPSLPSPLVLREAQARYGDLIVRFCEDHEGHQVGDGQSLTLAREALKSVGDAYQSIGMEPVGPSQGRVHGVRLVSMTSPEPAAPLYRILPGDILEIGNAVFHHMRSTDETGDIVVSETEIWEQTAVIYAVSGDRMEVFEQGGGLGEERFLVRRHSYSLGDLVYLGRLAIFRPIGAKWCPSLDTDWEPRNIDMFG